MGQAFCSCSRILEFPEGAGYTSGEGIKKVCIHERQGLAMDRLVTDRGKASYELRLTHRSSWREISKVVGISSRGCLRAARTHAERNNLPWPLHRCTKGGAIYSARKVMTWFQISNRYNSNIESVKRLAYKHAKRRGLPWPIRED